jgi:hypothetical protein
LTKSHDSGLDQGYIIVSTINVCLLFEGSLVVGQVIMLSTLFGLIVLIFGLVLYFDPEARRSASAEHTPSAGDEHTRGASEELHR